MDFKILTNYLDSLTEIYGVPAGDLKVMKGHKEVYRHMFGHSDYEGKTPLDKNVMYRMYSATKVITMTAVMQQIERGNLSFSDEVRKYLPEFDIMKVADNFVFEFPPKMPDENTPCHYAHRAIRIIDLMTMTAGLSYDTAAKPLMDIKEKSGNKATTREVVAEMAKMTLLYEPGTRYSYSLCHDVLAAVVEVTSGMRYSDYLRENIFKPLGCEELYFHWDENQGKRICAMYQGIFGKDGVQKDNGAVSESFKFTDNYESGGAGLCGTTDSYSMVLDALACGGVGATDKRILKEESVKRFTVPYTTGQMSLDFAVSGKVGYEYGLGVRVLKSQMSSKSPVGEFGWDGAAGAFALVDVKNEISITYMQHIMGFPRVYSEIHPMIRNLSYSCMGL